MLEGGILSTSARIERRTDVTRTNVNTHFARKGETMGKAVIVQAPQKWEHLALTRRSDTYLLEEVNREGQNGWELVSVLYYSDPKGIMAWTAFLKRPAVQQSSNSAASRENKESYAGTTAPSDPPNTPTQPKGFDLDGSEFQLHVEASKKPEPSGDETGAG